MKTLSPALLCAALAVAAPAAAWESHPAQPSFDENGDMRFDSEHVELTSEALTAADAFSFLGSPAGPPLEVCATVKDFNSAALGWTVLTEREFCPANFTELPDFFHSMEDYINQGQACPPLADWDVDECHTFEHFMGALNSSHFPPQTRANYEQYHRIAQAVTEQGNELHDKLFLAGAVSTYRDYWEECKLEALTYESIGQHYLQDQWAMGHMWYRWGGPDVDDWSLTGSFAVLDGLPRARLAYGTIVGGVSGMIHGWKSTVQPIWDIPSLTEDALSFYQPGVEWARPDLSGTFPGMGDLFLDQEGDFGQQRQELLDCTEEGFRQLTSFQANPSAISDLCWENFATNRAMNLGLNLSPSTYVSLGVLGPGATVLGIDGVGREMTNLALTFAAAAFWHPDDTYLAEGYTTRSRTQRLELFGVQPNDVYVEVSSYIDPARTAPGDPAPVTGVQPDNPLFGVRQVQYFNKCHADLYCEDPAILGGYRDGCQDTGSAIRDVDCGICEELAGRYFLGDPPLCTILAPGVDPDPSNPTPPATAGAVADWCRGVEEAPFPRTYTATGTRTLSVTGEIPDGSAGSAQRIDVTVTLYENGQVRAVMTTPDGPVAEVPVIGAPGQTRTIIENKQLAEVACPADATNNAGETVTAVLWTFGSVGWTGEWSEDGSYWMKYQSSYYDMTITGTFTSSGISGSLAWPDPDAYPAGYPSTNFICSRDESTVYSRIDWQFSGFRDEPPPAD